MTAEECCDVAVVGCGPVGGALATLLGRQGHRVVVIERHPEPYLYSAIRLVTVG